MSTIGFDTSNYTTSTAWTDGKTDINVRQILYVKDGERGIRQSDGASISVILPLPSSPQFAPTIAFTMYLSSYANQAFA